MIPDASSTITPHEHARFGDDESDRRPYGLTRPNGGTGRIALKLVLLRQTDDALIVRNPDKPCVAHARLPKHLIEWFFVPEMGAPDNKIDVTLPEWLAVREALI
jgi:hypothetical protein